MNISDIAIRRPVFTTMVMVALMVLGLVAFNRLPVELFPDISFPLITVNTAYPGAGPEEVEQVVTRPIEDAVNSLGGIDTVRSYSREGFSSVVIMFRIGTDTKVANMDVRDRVANARRGMPAEVQDSSFMKLDPSASPVETLVLSGTADPLVIRRLAEDVVRPALEHADGVAAVNVRGGQEREIEVQLSAEKLARYGIAISQVSQALGLENANVPTGRVDSGTKEASLRLQGEVARVDDLSAIIVANAAGSPVTVGDLGEVVDTVKEQRTLVRVNGQDAVAIDVLKQSGGNTVSVADALLDPIAELKASLPPGVHLDTIIDSSVFVRENAEHVQQELVLGALAAIAIIFLFMLDWRSTLISALALPTSIVTTFFGMYLAGFSLNMMSLMGLSLSVGFLVDDAIVVRENIFRHIEAGEDPFTAARLGTKEIALAVLATTCTILAVFVPVGFMGGMMGQMFRQFALTVSIAVAVSLFVAFTVDPMLSARLVKPHTEHTRAWGPLGVWQDALAALDSGYRVVLGWSLRHRWLTLLAATLVFFGSFGAVALMGTEFTPKIDRGQFVVNATLPPGTALAHTTEVAAELEKILTDDPDITLVYSTIGVNQEARKIAMRVTAVDKTERARTLQEITAELRKKFAAVPGIRFSFSEAGIIENDSDFRQADITLNLRGPEFATLGTLSDQLEAAVASTPGVTDPDTSFAPGLPELHVTLDRQQAAALGVSSVQAGMGLRSALVGDVATHYRDGEHETDVRVRLRPSDRADLAAIGSIPLPTMAGLTALRQLATLEESSGPATIEREARQRQITISAGVAGRSLGEVVAEIQGKIDTMHLPPGYTTSFAGQAKQMKETSEAFGVAMLLAIVFIYVVLASQFESFVHPITIMVSLPLAIIGAFLGLFLTGKALGMASMIGVVLLMGLVTKNAILLVDRANQIRDERGLSALDALLEAGPTRLRPIVMTSMTIVLGMLPTAMSNAPGSEFRSPMSIAVIGGVITSTALTLVVVPVVYTFLDRLTARGRADRAAALEPQSVLATAK
jgi:CzcA family heavy metal efflux pump